MADLEGARTTTWRLAATVLAATSIAACGPPSRATTEGGPSDSTTTAANSTKAAIRRQATTPIHDSVGVQTIAPPLNAPVVHPTLGAGDGWLYLAWGRPNALQDRMEVQVSARSTEDGRWRDVQTLTGSASPSTSPRVVSAPGRAFAVTWGARAGKGPLRRWAVTTQDAGRRYANPTLLRGPTLGPLDGEVRLAHPLTRGGPWLALAVGPEQTPPSSDTGTGSATDTGTGSATKSATPERPVRWRPLATTPLPPPGAFPTRHARAATTTSAGGPLLLTCDDAGPPTLWSGAGPHPFDARYACPGGDALLATAGHRIAVVTTRAGGSHTHALELHVGRSPAALRPIARVGADVREVIGLDWIDDASVALAWIDAASTLWAARVAVTGGPVRPVPVARDVAAASATPSPGGTRGRWTVAWVPGAHDAPNLSPAPLQLVELDLRPGTTTLDPQQGPR